MICSNYTSLCCTVSEIYHQYHSVRTYVTACDLEKSFGFDKTVEVTRGVRFPIVVQSYTFTLLLFETLLALITPFLQRTHAMPALQALY